MKDPDRFDFIDAKAGQWVEGFVTRDCRIVRPAIDEEGIALIGRDECGVAVQEELDRRRKKHRNCLTQKRDST